MSDFISVARVEDIPEQGLVVEKFNRQIAIFNIDGEIRAIDNICPHAGGPLGGMGLEGNLTMCPWHGWEFDVTTGECVNIEGTKVECFEVQVESGYVKVKI